MAKQEAPSEEMLQYRDLIIKADQTSLESYARTLITLSSGSLGLSIIFLKDIVGTHPARLCWFLIAAWACWLSCLFIILSSFYFSHRALRKTIDQIDKGQLKKGIVPGGCWTTLINWANPISGIAFVVGAIFMVIFSSQNIGDHNGTKTTATTTRQAAGQSAPASSAPSASSRPAPTIP